FLNRKEKQGNVQNVEIISFHKSSSLNLLNTLKIHKNTRRDHRAAKELVCNSRLADVVAD
ncbi:MAG: hypothetical protein M3286_00880, partial [Thermoproteota archaeon]|nr:hypothetical protein [Thermoproteota archaeon]